jgi:hypothetical protein
MDRAPVSQADLAYSPDYSSETDKQVHERGQNGKTNSLKKQGIIYARGAP